MSEERPSEVDMKLMEEALREAQSNLASGGAGVVALLASVDQTIAVAHNTIQETGDLINHAEMVLLHEVSPQLQKMGEDERHDLTVSVTLEPCLMCSAFGCRDKADGLRRALSEDANDEQMIVHNLTLPKINQQLIRGPFTLVPGIRRAEGRELLRRMNKAANAPADPKT
jgi:tRNA(Arg) A34 adenosine deaminase TadA